MTKSRIMYIEAKTNGLTGPARIGRVFFSKSGKTLRYRGLELIRISGYKVNYFARDGDSIAEYRVSGPRRDGRDALYGAGAVEIDDDVREEYWTVIRRMPQSTGKAAFRPRAKHTR